MEELQEDPPTALDSDASVRTKEQWLHVGRDLCGTIYYTGAKNQRGSSVSYVVK
ncbi:hypothetical protein KDAU_44210 [Dictyobacter aurantiacus]|uniref:Uncharacterized protein n=1 Tax=Dictyobacter aurantiacus TaxID=1936993 RepID=A0A401ZJT2_9CHLR|nr:hypothetical protein KDAU_44210 [Dictyobacter aurantiacus]